MPDDEESDQDACDTVLENTDATPDDELPEPS